jgi:hypothetical protein
VVQTVGTFQKGGVPAFVETLDAMQVGRQSGMPIAPVIICADDVSHVVTEEGVAYLYKAEGQEERRRALAGVAGVSPVGLKAIASETAALRRKGWLLLPLASECALCMRCEMVVSWSCACAIPVPGLRRAIARKCRPLRISSLNSLPSGR